MDSEKAKKTVLFLPLNSPGHMNSSLAIADRLKQDHGYRTVFVVVGQTQDNAIQSHGHEMVLIDEVAPYEDYEIEEGEDPAELDEERKRREGKSKRKFDGAARWPQLVARNYKAFTGTSAESFKNITRLVGDFMARGMVSNTPAVEAAIERLEPSLIVSDSILQPPAILLNEHARPWVRLHSANPLVLARPRPGTVRAPPNHGLPLYSREERDRIRREEPERWRALLDKWDQINRESASAWTEAYTTMRSFYQAHGCNRLDSIAPTIDSPHVNFYLYPEALDYDQEEDLLEYPPRMIRCDSLMREPAGSAELDALNYWREQLGARGRDRQVVFFSLGSIASGNLKLMQRYVDILSQDRASKRLYVVSKGVSGDKLQLDGRNMIGGNYVPQLFFLQRAHLAIIHGGNNSITECLYYGRPMIVLPNFFDQFDNAQRVEDLKLGKRLNVHRCTRDELLGAVDELLADKQLIERARAIGERMRARDELGKVSEVLRELVETRILSKKLATKYNIRLE